MLRSCDRPSTSRQNLRAAFNAATRGARHRRWWDSPRRDVERRMAGQCRCVAVDTNGSAGAAHAERIPYLKRIQCMAFFQYTSIARDVIVYRGESRS